MGKLNHIEQKAELGFRNLLTHSNREGSFSSVEENLPELLRCYMHLCDEYSDDFAVLVEQAKALYEQDKEAAKAA